MRRFHAAAHEAGNQAIFFVPFSYMFGGKKHRRITPSHTSDQMLRDLQRVAPSHVWRRTHVPESNRQRSLINSSTRLNHLAVGQGVDRQPELLGPEAFRRSEERTDKFAFDDFAAALDAEQVFHSAAQTRAS